MTSTGDIAGRAFSFDTEDAAYEFVDHAGLPRFAFTFRGQVRGLLYADGTPGFEPMRRGDRCLPAAGFWRLGLTEASAERLAAEAPEVAASGVILEPPTIERVTTINDAEIIGEMPQHVLDLKMVAWLRAQRDDKVWPAKALTFTDLLSILTKHPVGKQRRHGLPTGLGCWQYPQEDVNRRALL